MKSHITLSRPSEVSGFERCANLRRELIFVRERQLGELSQVRKFVGIVGQSCCVEFVCRQNGSEQRVEPLQSVRNQLLAAKTS